MHEYQLLPPLSEEEYAALKEDIAKRGVLVPVEYDEDGNILDGHHRVRACEELGIKNWPSIVRIGMSEDEKAEHVLKLNIARRHLPREWKQKKAKELREQGWSYRRIADVLGVKHITIIRWLKESGGTFVPPETETMVTGADGKQYPAKKYKEAGFGDTIIPHSLVCPYCGFSKWDREWLEYMNWPKIIECSNCYEKFTYNKSLFDFEDDYNEDEEEDYEEEKEPIKKPEIKPYVIVDKPKDVERVAKAVDKAKDAIPAKRVELKRLEKIAREVKEPIVEEVNLKEDPNIKLYNCDFRKLEIEPESIDLILTDPPYPKEFLPLWGDLAKFAKEKLKDHGYLIAYSGQYHMPEVINYLISELDYVWTFCLYHAGNTKIVNNVNVMCRWKPILIFQKGRSRFKQTIQDYIDFDRKEKAHHDWQQGLPAIQKFIEHFTNPGGIVCDPFSGSGTVALACKNTGRSFIGSEIDTESYNVARRRLFYEL